MARARAVYPWVLKKDPFVHRQQWRSFSKVDMADNIKKFLVPIEPDQLSGPWQL